jgi:hypothetical protein
MRGLMVSPVLLRLSLFTLVLAIAGGLLAACPTPKRAEPAPDADARTSKLTHEVDIVAGKNRYQFDPATWALSVMPGGTGSSLTISAPVRSKEAYEQAGSGRKFTYPGLGFSVRLEPDGDSLRVYWSASRKASLDWPRINVPEKGFLILPRGEGSYIPVADSDFRAYLSSYEMNTLEDLNMPFWGIECPGWIVTYMLDNPFYNRVAFKPDKGMTMSFAHDFPDIDTWRKDMSFQFFVDDSANKITPAAHFRSLQEHEGSIRTLSQKAADLPRIDRLIGAPHAYLWSEGPITEQDILPGAWKTIAAFLLRPDLASEDAAAIRSILTADDREALNQIESTDTPYGYLRMREAEVLSKIYAAKSSFILQHLMSHLRPRNEWGGGISTRMIDRLSQAGFDKFLLTVPDWSVPDANPDVAAYAEKKGYLFGTYDSYDSIHDPRTAGTDNSWPTAQFDKHYYETGRISDAAGNQLKGDPVFTSKDSKYYLGNYYPPSGPERFFKPVPLPDKYYHLFIDPRYRLPLYQAAYHDSVITTPHWESASRKFTTTRNVQAMLEILYQAAPLYHLNFATTDAELGQILRHARLFEKSHEYSYQYTATGFQFLDADRLVQRIRHGEMSMNANFSTKTFESANTRIQAGVIRIEWPNGEVTTYAPDN